MRRVISGGQIGVDRIALEVAKSLGFETGGRMPKGFLAIDGFHPEYAERYGMEEDEYANPKHRTMYNVLHSDATVIIAEHLSPRSGSLLTLNYARKQSKPYLFIKWPVADHDTECGDRMAQFCARYDTVNFAGNRSMTNIEDVTILLSIVFAFLKKEGCIDREA